jgi:hypothetical protein
MNILLFYIVLSISLLAKPIPIVPVVYCSAVHLQAEGVVVAGGGYGGGGEVVGHMDVVGYHGQHIAEVVAKLVVFVAQVAGAEGVATAVHADALLIFLLNIFNPKLKSYILDDV